MPLTEVATDRSGMILVVDEEAIVQSVIASILATHGYCVLTARTRNGRVNYFTATLKN